MGDTHVETSTETRGYTNGNSKKVLLSIAEQAKTNTRDFI